MKYEILNQGFIYRGDLQNPPGLGVTSRCVVTRKGELLCSFLIQSALARNDFVSTLAVSSDQGATWCVRGPVFPHLRETIYTR